MNCNITLTTENVRKEQKKNNTETIGLIIIELDIVEGSFIISEFLWDYILICPSP